MNKYRNKQTWTTQGAFDSRREAKRAYELSLLLKAGDIEDLRYQVKYELIPAQYEPVERYGKRGQRLSDGRRCVEKACTYIADFVYRRDGVEIVEDAKGVRTEVYRIKKKLMLYVHGIKIQEV
ncbi:MAG: DUF1064 domain-containing protein [Clostridia bacterium]|nr:DUF1064 domain-containing protein [Clostridia bacterium]